MVSNLFNLYLFDVRATIGRASTIILYTRRRARLFDLHGILGSPFSRCAIVSSPIRLEKLRNVRHQRIIRVGVGKERTDTQQNLTNRQCWTPLVLENIQADTSVRVDVAVVDACGKVNFGRLQ